MSDDRLPSYLVSAPSGGAPDPPVDTRKQTLPFEALTWPDFERLCLRIVDRDDQIEEAKIFGEPGEAQGGIDLLARRSNDALAVFQCRRVKSMGPAKIRQAVTDFLEGPWATKAGEFTICTPVNLGTRARGEEMERQRARMKAEGKDLGTLDLQQLSLKLKSAPDLVDDFFGRPWVAIFNGAAAASTLGERLDRGEATATRSDLAAFYKEVFQVHDAGLSLAPTWAEAPTDLRDLFVVPDLIEDVLATPISASQTKSTAAGSGLGDPDQREARERGDRAALSSRLHTPAETWLSAQRHATVVGDPGAGKSSLLRFLALDLLATEPRFPLLVHAWKAPIPLWIPFGRWTEIIEDGGERSIDSLLQTWLADLDQPKLLSIYRKALADRRAVLLIDGLDEWKTVGAARVALDQLRIFASAQGIRAIATARPSAFQQLGPPPGGWATAALAGLSNEQQLEAINRLSSWAISEAGAKKAALSVNPGKFVAELSQAADLRELASVPLTLVFLYWIRARDARLPRDRFAAYDALVDLLLAKYPARRTSAAAMLGDDPPVSEEDFRLALAALAYAVQLEGSGDIETDLAVETLRKHLTDEEMGPGLDSPQALALSRDLLLDARNRLGLLFESGPHRLAFLHRSVQEHLCAVQIARFALDSQIELMAERGRESQWVEVILNLIYLTTRPDDVDRLILALRAAREAAGHDTGDPLMAEIGAGRFGGSTRLSRTLVEESASYCETFARPAVAGSIAVKLLEGLHSPATADALQKRFRSWLPARPWSLQGLYAGMEDWPSDSKADRALERALFSEESRDALAAAEAYAARQKREGRDPDFLNEALSHPLTPTARAAALWALASGWPESPSAIEHLKDARGSGSAELRLIAIMAAVEAGDGSNHDLDQALELVGWDSSLGFGWRERVTETLIRGWPRNDRLKKVCLSDLTNRGGEDRLESGVALSVALWGFPFDPEVERYCVGEIRNEDHPFVILSGGGGAWRGLAANFHDMPTLVEAADSWLTKQKFHEPEVAYAALIGRTDTGKRRLLKDVSEGSFPFWAARSLLQGWGLEDAEVRDALRAVALGSNDQAGSIALYLPEIIKQKSQCKARLIELLEDESVRRPDLVLQGVIDLDDSEFTNTAVEVVFKRKNAPPPIIEVLASLIDLAPQDKRVKDLARQSLSEREPPVWALAEQYGDDADMRDRLSEMASPLPASTRTRCWERLPELVIPIEGLSGLARAFPVEQDGSLATLMARTFAVSEAEKDRAGVIDIAARELRMGGPARETHAQAALGALIEVNSLETFRDSTWGEEENPISVPLNDYLQPNVTLASMVVDRWDDLVEALGPSYPSRFSGIGDSATDTFWDVIAMVADRSPESRHAMSEYLRVEKPKWTVNLLGYVARTESRSERVRDACLAVLAGEGGEAGGPNVSWAACSILAEQFSSDAELGDKLVTMFETDHSFATLLALAEGWSGARYEKALRIAQRIDLRGPLPYIWRTRIAAGNPTEAIDSLESLLAAPTDSPFFPIMPVRTILNRISTDDQIASHLTEKLSTGAATASEYASYSRLLSRSVGFSKGLRASLRDLLKTPTGRAIGVDIVASENRAVAHSVSDALEDIQ